MSVEIIQERLTTYNCNSNIEEEQALREITQEIILAGLGRTNFFRQVGFQGGTCLRIFHSLNRFSEDMDFALIKPDGAFVLAPLLEQVRVELEAFGYALEIEDRSRIGAAVQHAFVKDESVGKLLHLNYRPRTGPMRKLRIKLEVDTNPPAGALYEMPVLDYPFPSAVRVFDLPSLFAGKIHALLCRNYLKGRDWYDFIWYTSRRVTPNVELLSHALDQQGPWAGQHVTVTGWWLLNALHERIAAIDWPATADDVARFVVSREQAGLAVWSSALFLQQLERLEAAFRANG